MKITLKAISCMVFFTCIFSFTYATNYFVSSINGNDNTNNGLTVATPFATIQKAANLTNAGDTVFVMNGTYTNNCNQCNVVTVTRAGTAAKWIVYKNFPNHKPLIQFNAWGGFMVRDSAAYIEVNGFTIKGNNVNVTLNAALNQPGGCSNPSSNFDPSFNGNGLATDGRGDIYGTGHPHHVSFLNNDISECGGGGISAIQSDYITVENNIIYNNCWYTVFGASGISFYQSWNLDSNFTSYKMIVKNNKVYGNKLMVPWIGCCCISDGNGIIIDDGKNTQNNSTIGRYRGKTLVTNNICIKNGGSGIHVFESENVDIVSNTTYQNSQSVEIQGEIFAYTSNNVNILNNIIYPINNEAANQAYTNYDNTNTIYDYNLYFNTNNIKINGLNDVKGNPNFVNPTLVLSTADFHLQTGSSAIDKGTANKAPLTDFENLIRPAGIGFDIGAHEFGAVLFPVSIGLLSTTCNKNNVLIDWKVFSAINIKQFNVETSLDGIVWTTIKTILNTTTTQMQQYNVLLTATENKLFRIAAVTYSNLVDKYSNIATSTCAIPPYSFSTYPNPFKEIILIKWTGKKTEGNLILVDALGRKIKEQVATMEANVEIKMDGKGLQSGVYFLQFISDSKQKWISKLTKGR